MGVHRLGLARDEQSRDESLGVSDAQQRHAHLVQHVRAADSNLAGLTHRDRD